MEGEEETDVDEEVEEVDDVEDDVGMDVDTDGPTGVGAEGRGGLAADTDAATDLGVVVGVGAVDVVAGTIVLSPFASVILWMSV